MGILSSLFMPIALKLVDRYLKKLFVSDPESYATWTKFMIGAQNRSWIPGSTPSEYEAAGKTEIK